MFAVEFATRKLLKKHSVLSRNYAKSFAKSFAEHVLPNGGWFRNVTLSGLVVSRLSVRYRHAIRAREILPQIRVKPQLNPT